MQIPTEYVLGALGALISVIWWQLNKRIENANRAAAKVKEEMEKKVAALESANQRLEERLREAERTDMERREAFGSRLFSEVKSLEERFDERLRELSKTVGDTEVSVAGMQATFITRNEYEKRRDQLTETAIYRRQGREAAGRPPEEVR